MKENYNTTIMASLTTLPSDVLCNILIGLWHHPELYNLIRSCKNVYQAFDERKALILGHVLANELQLRALDASFPVLPTRKQFYHDAKAAVEEIEQVVHKYNASGQDAVMLYTLVWNAFKDLQSSCDHDAVVFFHTTYARALISRCDSTDRTREASIVLKDALAFAQTHNLNKTPLVRVHRMFIKTLKTSDRRAEAIVVRKRIFDAMSAEPGEIWTTYPFYISWAHEYASDLRMLGRREEAIAVELQLWERLERSRDRNPTRQGLAYHCRNAAWALCKAYRERGDDSRADEFRRAFEDAGGDPNRLLAVGEEAMISDVIVPAERRPNTYKADMTVAINT